MAIITKETSPHFYKSKYYYRLAWYTFLWIVLFPQVSKVIAVHAIISALLILVPVVGFVVLVALGISSVIKSYLTKEPHNKYRAFYLFGHLFFAFLIVGLTMAIMLDIQRFSK